MSTRKQYLIDEVKSLLTHNGKGGDHACCEYRGMFYNFDDIDKRLWKPKEGAKRVSVNSTTKSAPAYQIGELLIHF